MKRILIFFIHFFIFTLIHCYIKIPLKLYPCIISEKLNITNIFSRIVMKQLYAKIEIGTPKQTLLIPLELEKNDFYVAKFNSPISNEKYDFFGLKNFKEELSSSFKYINEEKDKIYYNKNFQLASKVKDLFFFGDNSTELEFYLAKNLSEEIPGEIGLQIHEVNKAYDTKENSFLKKIKDNGIINNYIWTILYNIENNDNNDADAYLYIGDFLHNINSKELILKNVVFKEESLISINAKVYQNKVANEFEMSKLYLYKGDNPKEIIKEVNLSKMYLSIKLDYNLGGIKASEIIRPYLEENVFTEQNKCHKDYFYYNNKYIFYYCDKNPTTLKNIKNNFPTMNFIHQEFNFNFIINLDDIIEEKDDYYLFLIYFGYSKNKYDWQFGRPFLDKYNFMFDQDGKKIFLYSKKEEDKDFISPGIKNQLESGIQKRTIIFLVIILIMIILILSVFLSKKLNMEKIKKHKNLFEDDLNYSLSSGIEMIKK